MTATRIARPLGRAATLIVLAGLWLFAASLLWRTNVPRRLALPHLDVADYFTADELRRSARFERFLGLSYAARLAAELTALGALAVCGRRLARYFDMGRVGTGVLLGTLVTAVLWAVDLPFGLADQWWERRYGISRLDYGSWLGGETSRLGAEVAVTAIVVTLLMVIAGRFRERWWLPAGALVVVLGASAGLLYALALDLGTTPLRNRALVADLHRAARIERVEYPSVRVERVSEETTAANAEAIGVGPIRRLVFWNTILDGRFSRGELRVVGAHELAHLARQHVHRGFAWFALITLPLWYLVALVTRRRGGPGRPEAIPLTFLVVAVLQLAVLPLENMISRRYEAEADWIALGATRDPVSAQTLFERFAEVDLAQPDPPAWDFLLLENHPTIIQRIEMAEAWKRSRRPAASPASPAGS